MSRGTSALYEAGNHLLETGAGATIGLMEAEPGAQSTHTVLTFEVENNTDEVKDLEGHGVGFLDHDTPEINLAAYGTLAIAIRFPTGNLNGSLASHPRLRNGMVFICRGIGASLIQ